jgi:OmpA-OmpF porin, OOP family
MKTKLALLATSALAALAIATPANAAGGGWYLSLTGGANWLDDNAFANQMTVIEPDTLTIDSESDTGYVIAGAVGWSLAYLAPGLKIEAEVGYRQNQVDGIWTSDQDTAGAPVADLGTLDYDQSTLSVLANVWYEFDIGGVKPYIGGGLGWADVEVDGAYLGGAGAVRVFNFSDDGFAWQAGAGVNFQVAPNMQLGVGYRYMEGPEVTVLAPLAANLATGDLESANHSAVVTLTFGM